MAKKARTVRTQSTSRVAPTTRSWRKLSASVGDFIRYWGFRRIHGEIWTQLFLSAEGLSGTQLARRLDVSKALVSPALSELETHGLIRLEKVAGRDRIYTANEDVFSVVRKVLLSREVKMLEEAQKHFRDLVRHREDFPSAHIRGSRVEKVGELFDYASLLLKVAVNR